ncbi:MAG: DUF1501 domain-containing protein [Planctomycetota bacterium]
MKRRDLLHRALLLPALPMGFLGTGCTSMGPARPDGPTAGRRLLLVRLTGGNDGLSTLVPFRDDSYFRARPTVALETSSLLPVEGGDAALHPALRQFRELMDDGHAGLVPRVGYPRSSRSHLRATEIWATGMTTRPVPAVGWLGRYADGSRTADGIVGVSFGDDSAQALESSTDRTERIAHPGALLELARTPPSTGTPDALPQLAFLGGVEARLRSLGGDFERATAGSGSRHKYPDTAFGASLRWTADLIETGSKCSIFHASLGSFEGGMSFDTHLDQRRTHDALYAELDAALAAFARQLIAARRWEDTLVMTYSDFGRQVAENKTGGTDHGDAGLTFLAGGRVLAGVHGGPPDLTETSAGGLAPTVDFRSIYGSVLRDWLGGAPTSRPDKPFPDHPVTV